MLADWYAHALRGDSYEYGRGNLAHARYWRVRRRLADESSAEFDAICDAGEDAWRLYEAGKVTLVQRRIDKDCFAYIAQKL